MYKCGTDATPGPTDVDPDPATCSRWNVVLPAPDCHNASTAPLGPSAATARPGPVGVSVMTGVEKISPSAAEVDIGFHVDWSCVCQYTSRSFPVPSAVIQVFPYWDAIDGADSVPLDATCSRWNVKLPVDSQ